MLTEPNERLLKRLIIATAMINKTPAFAHVRFAMICTGYGTAFGTVAGAVYGGKCYIDTVKNNSIAQNEVNCHDLKNQSDTNHRRHQLEADRQQALIRHWWQFWRPPA